MREMRMSMERLGTFSDAVMAVIITIMVLELKAPEEPTFAALVPLWHTLISYAVSYLFIAIIWINHHYLLRFVDRATPALIWVNFIHLFGVSLLPFATAWMARTQLSAVPVTVYAAIFVFVNLAYLAFLREVLSQADIAEFPVHARRMAKRRSLGTLVIFTCAMLTAFFVPFLGFGLICGALFFYIRPEAPGSGIKQGLARN